ncbi:unnamed protein product [Moneuplotes crassus]|uniref:Uncharacterized protein n=1 Tax=Euplotes crassus TaxID=5936 RepID=A0AAD1U2G5_EUPCR|nr:unnamed protein product [Moneuplotes crassus]
MLSPNFQRNQRLCSPIAEENKRRIGNFRFNKRVLQNPLLSLRSKLKYFSPLERRIVQIACINSSSLCTKIIKKKLDKRNKPTVNEDFTHQDVAETINKFEDLSFKVKDAKAASGACKSSFVLSKKLETMKQKKERAPSTNQKLQISNEENAKGFLKFST